MSVPILNSRERRIADYLVRTGKNRLAQISLDCGAPVMAVRRALKNTAARIGNGALQNEQPLRTESWNRITVWIALTIFEQV